MKLNRITTALFASAVLALAASGARADTYQFALTGSYTATWQLNSSMTANDGDPGFFVTMTKVKGTYPGATSSFADISFFNNSIAGGLELDDSNTSDALVSTEGPQLYTGSETGIVTFKLGTFSLTEYAGTGRYTLTVTNVSAVPEPASTAMLLGGLGMLGALRLRRRSGLPATI